LKRIFYEKKGLEILRLMQLLKKYIGAKALIQNAGCYPPFLGVTKEMMS
jgi:hypothetical protein